MVEAVSLGVGGLFTKDLLPKFFDRVDKVIGQLEEAQAETGKSKGEKRRAAADKSIKELSKLNVILGAPSMQE